MICSRCGKENREHYKFCLGCGGELTAPSPAAPPGPGGVEALAAVATPVAPVASGVAQPSRGAEPAMVVCAACGTRSPAGFSFCGNCGAPLSGAAPAPAPAAAAPAPAPSTAPRVRLALIRPDGSEGGEHIVRQPEVMLGRGSGPLFDGDTYLSPQHVILRIHADHVIVEDAGSLNGVFVRIVDEEPLRDGDIFRIGQELLRFDEIHPPAPAPDGTEILGSPNPGYWGRISLVVGPEEDGSSFPLMGEDTVLGRERGDILFSDDGYVSGMHAKVSLRRDGVFLVDLGSSNGTFIRLRQARAVPFGTFILMGQQLFRLDLPR